MIMLSKKTLAGLTATILATACVGLSSGDFHKSAERGTDVIFASKTRFNNGDTLPAGQYRMEVAENSQTPVVQFYKESTTLGNEETSSKVSATVKARVVRQPGKNPQTEIDSVTRGNAQLVRSIRPAGWDEVLVFGRHGATQPSKSST